MIRRLFPRLFLLALPLLVAVPACSDDDDQSVDAGGTATSAVTVTTEPTVTTGSDGSTVTTALTPAGASPEDASQRLYDAWIAGDQAAASEVASEEALATLFAEPPETGYSLDTCRGSETVADATECDFADESGAIITFLVEGNGEDGFGVTQVGFLDA